MHAFPPGVHLTGGQNAAVTHRAAAAEFYAPIIPVVLALAEQGLSLRAIAHELDNRGIKTRLEYPGQRWSATQVKRVLLRAREADPDPAGEPEADEMAELHARLAALEAKLLGHAAARGFTP